MILGNLHGFTYGVNSSGASNKRNSSGLWTREGKVRALYVPDVSLGLCVAALQAPHPRDEFLQRIEFVRGLAGMRVTSRALE
jgi:hypothetical protein